MSGQVVAYARVSSVGQRLDRQLAAIGDVDRVFTDQVSGGSQAARQGLADMLGHVRDGDTIRVASMDRLARSLVDLAQLVDDLVRRGVRVEFSKEQLTFSPAATADPFATFALHMLGAVAQLERSLIRERQREGIDLAKARGVYDGRRKRLTAEQIAQARHRIATGVPKAKIARELECGRTALYDALAGRGAYAPKPLGPRSMAGGAEEVQLPL